MNHLSIRSMAIMTGCSLLLMALLAGFAYGVGFQQIYVPNNAMATLQNLQQSSLLFRFVLLAFFAILILDIIVAWALYYFFEEVNQPVSLLTALFRMVYSALLGVALSWLALGLHTSASDTSAAESLMKAFQAFSDNWSLALIIFGCHLISLGFLAVQAGFIPKIIGYLVLIAGCCYEISSVLTLLMVDNENLIQTLEMVLSIPMAAGELVLAFWLLFKGAKMSVRPLGTAY